MARAGEELLPSGFLLDDTLLHIDRNVNDVIDIEVGGDEAPHGLVLVRAEHIGDHESLAPSSLLALDVGRLVLLIGRGLVEKFADLVQELLLVPKLMPRLDAQDQVEATIARQKLGQVH